MTIHKIVGKHTTGDVRDYVGTAGELFYDDSTGLIRLADGFTAGGNALKLNEFEDQFVMMATSGDSWPELATSISTDGVRWTQAFSTTEFVDSGPDYESVEFFQTAIGGGRIVYLGYDYDAGQNCLFWADAANQAGNRSFSPASFEADTANGMDSGCLWIEDVQYINNYFVAVGYQQRYENDYNGGSSVKYPYWAYSADGEHWEYGSIDYTYMRKIIDTSDNLIEAYTHGLRAETVGGGGNAGIMITLRFYNYTWTGSPGFFYLADVRSQLNAQTYSGIPGLTDQTVPWLANYSNVGFRSVWHDDHGWVVWSNGNGQIHFNNSADPRAGKWRTSDWWQVARKVFGYGNTCIYNAAAGRLADGNSYFIMSGTDGRYYATRDQGRSWIGGVIGGAYAQNISGLDRGMNTVIYFDDNTDWDYGNYYNITKVKISGSNIDAMNGIFYAHRNNSTEWVLYGLDNIAIDSTEWDGYDNYSARCTFSFGDAMDYLVYGAGSFIAIDNDAPYVWRTTDLTADWNWEETYPVFDGNSPNDWTWQAGNWSATIAQYHFQGPCSGIGCISFGRIGTHSGLLRSDSRRISGRTNVLNLADNFSVSVMNGVQGGENLGIGTIELRPGLPGGLWSMGTSYWQGPGTAIYSDSDGPEYTNVSIDVWNPNNGDGATWTFKYDGIYYGGEKIVSAP